MKRLIKKVLTMYKCAVKEAFSDKYLLYTNVCLSISISMAGDTIEQHYELHQGSIDKFDYTRMGHMGFSGGTAGVICHNWYKFIDRVIIGRSLTMVFKKLMLDQFICSPIVILAFFATVAIFEDNPLQSFSEEVTDKFWVLYKAEWMVWPPAQIINFYFLPTKYRVLYDNTVSLGYDIYTSQVKHMKRSSKKTTEE